MCICLESWFSKLHVRVAKMSLGSIVKDTIPNKFVGSILCRGGFNIHQFCENFLQGFAMFSETSHTTYAF